VTVCPLPRRELGSQEWEVRSAGLRWQAIKTSPDSLLTAGMTIVDWCNMEASIPVTKTKLWMPALIHSCLSFQPRGCGFNLGVALNERRPLSGEFSKDPCPAEATAPLSHELLSLFPLSLASALSHLFIHRATVFGVNLASLAGIQ
jgi:hypothetical protein